MDGLRNAPLSRGTLAAWAWPGLAALAMAFAYRPLLIGALSLPAQGTLDEWFFRPAALPSLLVLGAGAWLAWNRRSVLASAATPGRPRLAALLAGLGGTCFAWALLTRTADLFFPSLSLHLLAFGAATAGWVGCRAFALPALVLLLGVQIPTPLLDEIVWRLQLWTAAGSALVLQLAGRAVVQGGAMLVGRDHTFEVIDACSGQQGIMLLLLVSILVRDLFGHSRARLWWLVVLAPPLGGLLNVVRIAVVAAHPASQGGGGDHTIQGLAVITAGTAVLYAIGYWLSGGGDAPRRPAGSPPALPWRASAAWLVALAIVGALVKPFAPVGTRMPLRFPEASSSWTSEPVAADPHFLGVVPSSLRSYRIYARPVKPPEEVELFIGRESHKLPQSSQLLASKLHWPGPAWEVLETRRDRVWLLDQDAELTFALRPSDGQYALLYTWRLRDEGVAREALRSLLSLESSPFARDEPRTVVRLLTYLPNDGPQVRDRAKRILERFVADFRGELAEL